MEKRATHRESRDTYVQRQSSALNTLWVPLPTVRLSLQAIKMTPPGPTDTRGPTLLKNKGLISNT